MRLMSGIIIMSGKERNDDDEDNNERGKKGVEKEEKRLDGIGIINHTCRAREKGFEIRDCCSRSNREVI